MNPFLRLMKDRTVVLSYRVRLILALMAISTIPGIGTLVLSEYNFTRALTRSIGQSNLSLLGQVEVAINSMVSEVYTAISNLSIDQDLHHFSSHHFLQDHVRFNRLQDRLVGLVLTSRYITSIDAEFEEFHYSIGHVKGQRSGFYHTGVLPYTGRTDGPRADGIGNYIWHADAERSSFLTAVRSVPSTQTRRRVVVVVTVTRTQVQSIIGEIVSDTLGDLYLVGSEKKILLQSRTHTDFTSEEVSHAMVALHGTGSGIVSIRGTRYLASFLESGPSIRGYVSFVPMELVKAEIGLTRSIVWYLSSVLLATALIISFTTGSVLYRPLAKLVDYASQNRTRKKGPEELHEFTIIRSSFEGLLEEAGDFRDFLVANREILREKVMTNLLLGHSYTAKDLSEYREILAVDLEAQGYVVALVRPVAVDGFRGPDDRRYRAEIARYVRNHLDSELSSAAMAGSVSEVVFENIAIVISSAGYDESQWDRFLLLKPGVFSKKSGGIAEVV